MRGDRGGSISVVLAEEVGALMVYAVFMSSLACSRFWHGRVRWIEHENKTGESSFPSFFLFPAPPTFRVPFTFASSPLYESLIVIWILFFFVYSSLMKWMICVGWGSWVSQALTWLEVFHLVDLLGILPDFYCHHNYTSWYVCKPIGRVLNKKE